MNWKWPLIFLLASAAYAAVLFVGVDATWVRPRGDAALASDAPPVKAVATRPAATPASAPAAANPMAGFTRAWRDDPIWHDGQAEIATYEATRVIYGKPRTYLARLMTNKEFADPVTKTKSSAADPAASGGREAFKHHLREDVPTDRYTYHFSTMAYVGVADLKSLKLDVGSQEDCGATFKQYINHKGTLTWNQFSYFPDQGHRSGTYNPPPGLVFENGLSLILRGFPFDDPIKDVKIDLLSNQTTSKLSDAEPQPAHLIYSGKQTLELPIGTTEAHLIVLVGDKAGRGEASPRNYWFAADGKPPMLHALVQYKGADGTIYKLKSLERRAYWQR